MGGLIRIIGRVKWFSDSEGYGFIECADFPPIFVHYSAVQGETPTLEPGQLVEFEVVQGPKGPMAEKVTKVMDHVTDSTFEQKVLRSTSLVLVNFWAEWCKECRLMSQTLESVAAEFANRVTVVKLNVDENPVVSRRYGIDLVPTLILFKVGLEEERVKGVTSGPALLRMVERCAQQSNKPEDRTPPNETCADEKSPYEILNVPDSASREEIVFAYKQMAKLYHPDKVASLAPEFRELAEKRMKEINLAYEVLLS